MYGEHDPSISRFPCPLQRQAVAHRHHIPQKCLFDIGYSNGETGIVERLEEPELVHPQPRSARLLMSLSAC
jgi:hypothetical protein